MPSDQKTDKTKKRAIIVIFLTVFIDLVGFGIIIPLTPYISRAFKATAFEVGALMAVYSLAQFIFSPYWGRLSDRIGRRPIILISLMGSTLSYLAFAYSTQLWHLFLARTFAGIFGANISTAMAYIADVTDESERSKSMGIIGAAFGMGFVFGPAIGGLLAHIGEGLGSQPPFGIGFPALGAFFICLINFLLAVKSIKETRGKKKESQLRRTDRMLILLEYLKRPIVGALILVFFMSGLAMAHMESTLGLFVKEELGWRLKSASFAFAYVGVIMVITQGYLIRRLMPRYGERNLMITGLLLCTIGFGGIPFGTTPFLLGVFMTFLAVGNGFVHPSILGSISLLATKDEQGATMGVTQSISSLGRIIGPASGGYLYGKLGFQSPFFAAALFAIVGWVMAGLLYSKLPSKGRNEDQKVGAH